MASPLPTTAWLIERSGPDGPEWFFAREKSDSQTAFGWSRDANEAVRFETKDEADAWRRELCRIVPALMPETESTVTEHQWGP